MGHSFSWEKFNTIPLVGIIRNIPSQHVALLAKHYYESGLTTLEVTMNSAGAAGTITRLAATFGEQMNIGAGTVCTIQDLDNALSAGAQFIVTPILNEEVIRTCVERNIPVFPGAYTPTEIYKAWTSGASMVKVFPATKLGVDYVKEVLAPLNDIKLLPTGGITLDNFTDFLKAGARGVGLGSHLFPKQLIEKQQWNELRNHFSGFVKKYQQYFQP